MSKTSNESDLTNDDDPIILEAGDNEENVRLDEDDEMLLLSSPSPRGEEEDSSEAKRVQQDKHTANESAELLTSSDKILVESESAEEFDTGDSVEVIDSEDESVNDCEEEEDVEDVESSSTYLDGKVQIFYVHGSLFIWNADDVRMLREECRIIGKLSGCLPRAPHQNSYLGLPLQLMPEEAKLLEEIEAACVVEELEVNDEDEKLRKAAFEQTRQENFKIQQRLYKESRKEEITQHMDEIVAGRKAKKRKLQELAKSDKIQIISEKGEIVEPKDEDITKKSSNPAINDSGQQESGSKSVDEANDSSDAKGEDHAKDDTSDKKHAVDEGRGGNAEGQSDSSDADIPDVDNMVTTDTDIKHSLVQIFTENPWHHDVKRCKNWIFPLSQRDRLRYAVYRDLWRKGYYLTSGSKFGGDFLVYPGDPARFHSHYIAICIDISEDMSVLDLVSMARLASNVRKTALIASFNKLRQVSYFSLQWTGMV